MTKKKKISRFREKNLLENRFLCASTPSASESLRVRMSQPSQHEVTNVTDPVLSDIFENVQKSSLTSIKIHECYINSFDICQQVECLHHLYLTNNAMEEFHVDGNFPNLQTLSLSCNNLIFKTIQGLESLESLTSLDLSQNNLGELTPDSGLFGLSNLSSLSLSGCGLKSIPDSISMLKNLEILSLERNNLTRLPECMFESFDHINLKVFENFLVSPPQSVVDLGFDRIKSYIKNERAKELIISTENCIKPNYEIVLMGNKVHDVFDVLSNDVNLIIWDIDDLKKLKNWKNNTRSAVYIVCMSGDLMNGNYNSLIKRYDISGLIYNYFGSATVNALDRLVLTFVPNENRNGWYFCSSYHYPITCKATELNSCLFKVIERLSNFQTFIDIPDTSLLEIRNKRKIIGFNALVKATRAIVETNVNLFASVEANVKHITVDQWTEDEVIRKIISWESRGLVKLFRIDADRVIVVLDVKLFRNIITSIAHSSCNIVTTWTGFQEHLRCINELSEQDLSLFRELLIGINSIVPLNRCNKDGIKFPMLNKSNAFIVPLVFQNHREVYKSYPICGMVNIDWRFLYDCEPELLICRLFEYFLNFVLCEELVNNCWENYICCYFEHDAVNISVKIAPIDDCLGDIFPDINVAVTVSGVGPISSLSSLLERVNSVCSFIDSIQPVFKKNRIMLCPTCSLAQHNIWLENDHCPSCLIPSQVHTDSNSSFHLRSIIEELSVVNVHEDDNFGRYCLCLNTNLGTFLPGFLVCNCRNNSQYILAVFPAKDNIESVSLLHEGHCVDLQLYRTDIDPCAIGRSKIAVHICPREIWPDDILHGLVLCGMDNSCEKRNNERDESIFAIDEDDFSDEMGSNSPDASGESAIHLELQQEVRIVGRLMSSLIDHYGRVVMQGKNDYYVISASSTQDLTGCAVFVGNVFCGVVMEVYDNNVVEIGFYLVQSLSPRIFEKRFMDR